TVWIVEAKATGALATGGSALDAVAEVHDTVAEPALLQQLQLDAGVAGECGLAFTDEHRINEELALIDRPGVERVRGEGRSADGQVAADGGTPLARYVQARVPKCDIRPSSERRHGSRVRAGGAARRAAEHPPRAAQRRVLRVLVP